MVEAEYTESLASSNIGGLSMFQLNASSFTPQILEMFRQRKDDVIAGQEINKG